MTLNLPAPENWSGEMNLQAQPAPANWSEVRTSKSERQRWNSTICKSPTIRIPWGRLPELSEKLNLVEEAPIVCTEALKTKVLIWGLFMSTTTEAAIHLGPNYVEKLEVYRNTNFEELQDLFVIAQKLILDHQAEILNVTRTDWTAPSWTRSTLSHDRVIRGGKQEYVSTQIPSCVWENCQIIQKRIKDGKNQVEEFRLSNSHRELLVIDGEPTEFACNISQDVRRWRSSR